jgi:hypothetical protein
MEKLSELWADSRISENYNLFFSINFLIAFFQIYDWLAYPKHFTDLGGFKIF